MGACRMLPIIQCTSGTCTEDTKHGAAAWLPLAMLAALQPCTAPNAGTLEALKLHGMKLHADQNE